MLGVVPCAQENAKVTVHPMHKGMICIGRGRVADMEEVMAALNGLDVITGIGKAEWFLSFDGAR